MASPVMKGPEQDVASKDFKKYYFDKLQEEAFLRQLLHDKFIVVTAEKGAGVSTFLNYISATIQHKIRPEITDVVPEQWHCVKIRPGINPTGSFLKELSRCDFSDVKKSISFESECEQLLNSSNSLGLVNLFKAYPVRENERLLIIVDPLDDLFLFEESYQSEAVNKFINLLYTFPQYSSLPVYFVISFANRYSDRSNYYIKLLDLLYKYKFKFTGPDLEDIPKMVGLSLQDLPKDIRVNLDSFSSKLKNDLVAYKTDNAWKYLLQLVLKGLREECLRLWEANSKSKTDVDWNLYYTAIGGVSKLVEKQAEDIRCQLSELDQDLCFMLFRTQINKQGNFEAIRFHEIIEITSGVKKQEYQLEERLEKLVKIFTVDLELLELIHPIEVADRGSSLTKNFKISPGTIIMLRNSFFKTHWSFFSLCVEEKVKLALDYEWYCRLAQNQKKDEYPVSLQPYAIAERSNPDSINKDEFSYINTILELTPAWIIRNVGSKKSDIEDLAKTKTFIKKGIAFWKMKADDEEKERKRIAKRRERVIVAIFVVVILLGVWYSFINNLMNRTQDNYDMLMQQNMSVRRKVDDLFGEYLRNNIGDSDKETINNKIATFKRIKGTLAYTSKNLQVDQDFFLKFFFTYNAVKERQKDTIISIKYKGSKALHDAIHEFSVNEVGDDEFKIREKLSLLKSEIGLDMINQFGKEEYDDYCVDFPDKEIVD